MSQKADHGVKAVKYTFDTHFDQPVGRKPEPRPEQKLDARAVEEVKLAAFAEGAASGKSEAESGIANKISGALDMIAGQLQKLEQQEFARRQAAKKDVARLAHLIGGKLAATLIKAHPIGEIEALVAECLTICQQEPKLVIKLNDALIAPMHEKIEALKLRQHLESQIILIGDDNLPLGDGQIEWNDGGAERNSAELEQAIEDIVERYVHSIKLVDGGQQENENVAPGRA